MARRRCSTAPRTAHRFPVDSVHSVHHGRRCTACVLQVLDGLDLIDPMAPKGAAVALTAASKLSGAPQSHGARRSRPSVRTPCSVHHHRHRGAVRITQAPSST